MARVEKRKCKCCGHEYEYCPTCRGADRVKPAWYSEFCCEECKEIFNAAVAFNMGIATKEESAKRISKLQLKPRDQYVACIQKDLNNIIGEEKKAVTSPTPQKVVNSQKVVQPTVNEVVKKDKKNFNLK